MWGRLITCYSKFILTSEPYLCRFTTFDSAPKKYQNAGLRKDLQLKRAPEDIDPFQVGGLDDEDIISVWPSFSPTNNVAVHSDVAFPADLQHDHLHKNKVCTLLLSPPSIILGLIHNSSLR